MKGTLNGLRLTKRSSQVYDKFDADDNPEGECPGTAADFQPAATKNLFF